ncbi:hypothetical protein Dimus_004303 [Dionaea muscipula]
MLTRGGSRLGSSPPWKVGCPPEEGHIVAATRSRPSGARQSPLKEIPMLADFGFSARLSLGKERLNKPLFSARQVSATPELPCMGSMHDYAWPCVETEPGARPCPPALLAIIILRCPPSPLEEGDAHERRKPPRQLAAMEGRLPAGGRAHRSRHALPPSGARRSPLKEIPCSPTSASVLV